MMNFPIKTMDDEVDKYPYWSLDYNIKVFEIIFDTVLIDEDFKFVKFWLGYNYVFIITEKTNDKVDYYFANEILINIGREYGWIITDDGVLMGYNPDNCIRNKHLLTCSELGLL